MYWPLLKKIRKRNFKNIDYLRENIMDIRSKFLISLSEKICEKFKDKMEYVEKFGREK